jgi:putative phosphoesterase
VTIESSAPVFLRITGSYTGRVILGILSDTHDRANAMTAGLKLLKRQGATFFIHCGDIGDERMIDLLAGEPSVFVWGNCDWDRAGLRRYADSIGVDCRGTMADLSLGGKRIAVLHGDEARLKQAVLSSQDYDYILQGHTHVAADERIGRSRLINPGALHRAAVKSVATLDLASDLLTFHPIVTR